MPTLYPRATYKPLGVQSQPKLVNPTAIIIHTMGGYLNGTDSTFRKGGYTGTESHFGIGGSWDGPNYDGIVWQWQDLDYTADAEYEGNGYGISIETSDGALVAPWTTNQVESLINLLIWLCIKYKINPKLIPAIDGNGIGYHSQFPEWNRDGHTCPGALRISQLINTVIPAVAARITIPRPVGDDMSMIFLVVDGPRKGTQIFNYGSGPVHITPAESIELETNPAVPVKAISDATLKSRFPGI